MIELQRFSLQFYLLSEFLPEHNFRGNRLNNYFLFFVRNALAGIGTNTTALDRPRTVKVFLNRSLESFLNAPIRL